MSSRHTKSIDLTTHAEERMKARGITRPMIEQAVQTPSSILPGNTEVTQRLERDFPPAKRLVIIIEELSDCVKIITAYWV